MNWQKIFEKRYKPYLDVSKRVKRAQGFEIIFENLINLNKDYYTIIETGTTRRSPSDQFAWKDGMGTLMFEEFVKHHGGIVHTVDIDQAACDLCNSLVGNNVQVHCMDSIDFLKNKTADFYYLDSWDVDRTNPQLSQEHHLKEFKTIEKNLKNCIVAIDDNFAYNGKEVGKGYLVKKYLEQKRIYPIYDSYQIIYKF